MQIGGIMDNKARKRYLETLIPKILDDYIVHGENYVNDSLLEEHLKVIPKKLYQYNKGTDDYLRTFEKSNIWFSKASNMDDDSDLTLYLDIEKEIAEIQNNTYTSIIHFGHRLVEISFKSTLKPLSSDIINDYISSCFIRDQFQKKQLIRILIENDLSEDDAFRIGRNISRKFNQIKRKGKLHSEISKVLELNSTLRETFIGSCFSEVYSDDHMWKEYADKSTGFCVEYTIPSRIELDSLGIETMMYFLPIYYGEKTKLSVLDLLASSAEASLGNFNELTKNFFVKALVSLFTKKDDWGTQREWRILSTSSSTSSNSISFPFASAVYLGEKMSFSVEERVLKVAKDLKLKVFKQANYVFGSHKVYKPR